MKRVLFVSLLFAVSAVHAAGPQFATPPVPAAVRVAPNYPTSPMNSVLSAPRVLTPAPVAPPGVKAAPAPGFGTLGPPLPRSFDGWRVLTAPPASRPAAAVSASRPAAAVPVMPGSFAMPVFPPPAGAIVARGPREVYPGVFLDFPNRR